MSFFQDCVLQLQLWYSLTLCLEGPGREEQAHNPGERVILRDLPGVSFLQCVYMRADFFLLAQRELLFLSSGRFQENHLSLYTWISPNGSYSPILFLLGFLHTSTDVLHGVSLVSVYTIIIMPKYCLWLPTVSFSWHLVHLTILPSISKTHSQHLYVFVSRIYMSLKYQGPNPTRHINLYSTSLQSTRWRKSWLCAANIGQ